MKKIIALIIILLFFLTWTYHDKVPYPLIYDYPENVKLDDAIVGLQNECFVVEGFSGNYYFGYASIFNIRNYDEYRKNPGLFFGKEIDHYVKFNVLFDESDTRYSLVQPVEECKKPVKEVYKVEKSWTVLKNVSTKLCQELAPNIKSKCLGVYYIDVFSRPVEASYTSLNPSSYGIFGLFDLEDVGLSIVPLKYFSHWYDGSNYLWFKEYF